MTAINEASGSDAGSRHATNLELFLDLVFVFAVTQVTSFVAHDPTLAGAAKGLLLAWLAWWQWTAFTWAGTAVDLEGDAMKRVMVLCMIPAVLVMAITLPQALTTQGLWFAGAYWLVQVWVLALQGVDALKEPGTRSAFLAYAPAAVIARASGYGRTRQCRPQSVQFRSLPDRVRIDCKRGRRQAPGAAPQRPPRAA